MEKYVVPKEVKLEIEAAAESTRHRQRYPDAFIKEMTDNARHHGVPAALKSVTKPQRLFLRHALFTTG